MSAGFYAILWDSEHSPEFISLTFIPTEEIFSPRRSLLHFCLNNWEPTRADDLFLASVWKYPSKYIFVSFFVRLTKELAINAVLAYNIIAVLIK